MAYNFEVDYERAKLLLTGLKMLEQLANESDDNNPYVFHVQGTLEMDHGVEQDSEDEDEINSEYFESVQEMMSELEALL